MVLGLPLSSPLGVVPVLVGPLQVLAAILPGLLVALGGILLSLFKPAVMKAGAKLLWRLKWHVLLAALAVGGIGYAAQCVMAGRGAAVGGREAGTQDWPLFRGSLARSGAVPGQPGPTAGGVKWSSAHLEKSFLSSPAVVGNRVYATSAKIGIFGEQGVIYCFDADTGGVVWRCAPKGYRATFSSPAVSGKYLVVGEGLHFTRDARVVCVDAAERPGEVLWEFRTGSHVESSPAISDGRVYIGAGDDGYYCFELQPEKAGSAKVIWHTPPDKFPDAETCPAVHDGRVYVGLGMNGCAICCLDAKTGGEVWRIATPYPVFGPATIAGGRLYVGMGNGNFVQTAEEVRAAELKKLREKGVAEAEVQEAAKRLGPAGEVWCVDLATAKVLWRFKASQVVLTAVAAGADRTYFGARDGNVYAVSNEGVELARWSAHSGIFASPALSEKHLYVVTEEGRLYALDREALRPAWEIALGQGGMFFSSPAIARGHAYVGTQNDGLLCVGEPSTTAREPFWTSALGGAGSGGAPDQPPVAERGAFVWNYPEGQDDNTRDPIRVTAPAVCVGAQLLVPIAAGPRLGLACLPVEPRAEATPKERWFAPAARGIAISPAVAEGKVFFVEGKRGEGERKLRAVNLDLGKPCWELPVATEASGELAAGSKQLYIQAQPGTLHAVDLSGRPQWMCAMGELRGAPTVDGPRLIVACESPPSLAALDGGAGRTLWRVALPAAPLTNAAVCRQRIYIGGAEGVEARRITDGAPVSEWQVQGGAVSGGAFALTPRHIVFVNAAGELVIVSAANGELTAKHAGAAAGVPPVVSREAALYAAGQGLMRLALGEAQAKPELWLDISWLGAPTSAPLLSDAGLYVGLGKWGLVRADKSR